MPTSHDERLQELRALQAGLAAPGISMDQIHSILRVLVEEAIELRERLKKGDSGGGQSEG